MAERKLTVVQVLPAMESGGVERGTLEVAAELVRRGHRSIVISAGGRLVPELEAAGTRHIRWPIGAKTPTSLRYVRKLRTLLREYSVDILHARSRLPAWIAYFAWRKLDAGNRPAFVTTVHGFYSVSRYSAIMTRAERVIAVSDATAQYVRTCYPRINPQRLVVIHRGVDRAEFPYDYHPDQAWWERWYGQYPQLRNRRVLTLPGRLTRLKGHEQFLELIAQLNRAGRPVHGLIVGGEDPRRRGYAQELRDSVARLGIRVHITFTGTRDDMRDIYAASDLILSLSSKPESFGRTVIEALSLGVPVLGYDHGGVGEILRAVYPAGLVAPGDFDQLRTKTEAMLERMPKVPTNHPYDLATSLAKTLDLYQAVCRASSRAH